LCLRDFKPYNLIITNIHKYGLVLLKFTLPKHSTIPTSWLREQETPIVTLLMGPTLVYDCPYTGAVTIRTSLWQEFRQDVTTHQYAFFSTTHGACRSQINTTSYAEGRGEVVPDLDETSSLNTLGYSPVSFMNYCNMLTEMSRAGQFSQRPIKPFIVSVTGDEVQVGACLAHLMELQSQPETSSSGLELMMEVNLSCPNIPDKAPPAYDGPALMKYITVLAKIKQLHSNKRDVQVGIKTPPYTYHGQFVTLVQCLESSAELSGNCPITFITATNTLGGYVNSLYRDNFLYAPYI